MAITTLLFYRLAVDCWGWSIHKAMLVPLPLFLVDVAFFSANVPKIPDGGWLPVVVGLVLVVQMTTWRRGREIVARMRRAESPTERRRRGGDSPRGGPGPGTAVFLFKDPGWRRRR